MTDTDFSCAEMLNYLSAVTHNLRVEFDDAKKFWRIECESNDSDFHFSMNGSFSAIVEAAYNHYFPSSDVERDIPNYHDKTDDPFASDDDEDNEDFDDLGDVEVEFNELNLEAEMALSRANSNELPSLAESADNAFSIEIDLEIDEHDNVSAKVNGKRLAQTAEEI